MEANYSNEEIKRTTSSITLPVLEMGCEGGTVVALQLMLQEPRLLAKGFFGTDMEPEAKERQINLGLTADSSMGPETWSNLLGATK